jgi:nucleotide-binding universal stress UspA family protein
MYERAPSPSMAPGVFSRIAVATDGSEMGSAAVDVAIDLAQRYDAELLILSVAPPTAVLATPNGPFVATTVADDSAPRFRAIVEAAVERAQAAGLESVTGVCEEGVVVDEILDHVATDPPDLLVVGSRGLSTAQRLLLGSVSTALVTRAPCPVLVVRTKPKPSPPRGTERSPA